MQKCIRYKNRCYCYVPFEGKACEQKIQFLNNIKEIKEPNNAK